MPILLIEGVRGKVRHLDAFVDQEILRHPDSASPDGSVLPNVQARALPETDPLVKPGVKGLL